MSALDPAAIERLVLAAWQAWEHAYAPYSHFRVGAAVLAGSGKVYPGANVENASFGLTICAERAAVCSAVSAGEREIRAVAVVTEAEEPTPPCGACRQVLGEFGPAALVIARNRTGRSREWRLGDLLPDAFGPESIG